MVRKWQNEAGWTWIELVILFSVLGIALALAVPRIQWIFEKFREAQTKSYINAIKSAISIYYGDHEGVWPDVLETNDRTPRWGFGSYIDAIPPVLVTYPKDPSKSPAGNKITYKSFYDEPSLALPANAGHGWRYDGPKQGNTGRIWVNSTMTDTQGESYSTYGYQ
jgi:type II secretory pathway pseudopilin PulG